MTLLRINGIQDNFLILWICELQIHTVILLISVVNRSAVLLDLFTIQVDFHIHRALIVLFVVVNIVDLYVRAVDLAFINFLKYGVVNVVRPTCLGFLRFEDIISCTQRLSCSFIIIIPALERIAIRLHCLRSLGRIPSCICCEGFLIIGNFTAHSMIEDGHHFLRLILGVEFDSFHDPIGEFDRLASKFFVVIPAIKLVFYTVNGFCVRIVLSRIHFSS